MVEIVGMKVEGVVRDKRPGNRRIEGDVFGSVDLRRNAGRLSYYTAYAEGSVLSYPFE